MKKIKPINSKTLKASKKTYDDLFEDLDFYIKTKLKADQNSEDTIDD